MSKGIVKESRVDKYKKIFFYNNIINAIKDYAIKYEDRILLKYLQTGILNEEKLEETLENEEYLKTDENTINIPKYIKEYIYNSEEYKNFKIDKTFILENLLNNVKAYNSEGKVVNIKLSMEQKDIVLQQYEKSFDSNIKEQIENNPDQFEEMFIANNSSQFERLFPKTYVETIKEQSLDRFKNENAMEAVRYCLAYPDNMKSAMSRQYVNNNQYKTLLVFNNNKNILGLTKENIVEEQNEYKEKQEEKEIEQKVNHPKEKAVSIFIKLSGEEKETSNGMYLPIDSGTQIFIPKRLYKIDGEKLEIMDTHSEVAKMSEYKINNENNTKKWINSLSLDNFYEKYFKLYGIQMDREVVV